MRLPQEQQTRSDKSYSNAVTTPESLTLTPIGVVQSPFKERFSAPRQPDGNSVTATILLHADVELACRDLTTFSHIWILFWFHLNQGWNPQVAPPGRGKQKRGLFATRAPHRPNPVGLSAVRLIAHDKRQLTIEAGDLLDGTPVLDIKPYIPYSDCITDANSGWLRSPLQKS